MIAAIAKVPERNTTELEKLISPFVKELRLFVDSEKKGYNWNFRKMYSEMLELADKDEPVLLMCDDVVTVPDWYSRWEKLYEQTKWDKYTFMATRKHLFSNENINRGWVKGIFKACWYDHAVILINQKGIVEKMDEWFDREGKNLIHPKRQNSFDILMQDYFVHNNMEWVITIPTLFNHGVYDSVMGHTIVNSKMYVGNMPEINPVKSIEKKTEGKYIIGKVITKYYLPETVFQESLNRIRFLYDEFGDNLVVSVSGGKDSTVILNLARIVAQEKGKEKVNVFFLDQESEWSDTIEYMRWIMSQDWVNPYWLQVPFKLLNSSSSGDDNQWLYCWKEGSTWIRQKEDIAIKENIFGTDRFHDLFDGFMNTVFKGEKACFIGGVRTDESPTRLMSLTSKAKYKYITWAKPFNQKEERFVFYPIYDWGTSDVWKAIFDNGWKYCDLYNKQFQRGVPWNKMRLSSLIHENAIEALFYVQEYDPVLYEAMVKRMDGVHACGKIEKENWYPSKLPYMFKDWIEYREYLLDNLVHEESFKDKMRSSFKRNDPIGVTIGKAYYIECIKCVVNNDYTASKLEQMIIRNKYLSNGEFLKARSEEI